MHDAATECVCSLLERIEFESRNEDASGKLEFFAFLSVCGLQDAYKMAQDQEDHVKLVNLCRIFTEMGEALLVAIVAQPPATPHFAVGILDCVLMCCGHTDYDIPDITFNLW